MLANTDGDRATLEGFLARGLANGVDDLRGSKGPKRARSNR